MECTLSILTVRVRSMNPKLDAMSKHVKPLTPKQIACSSRMLDIDFNDIPDLDNDFWRNAALIEPDRNEQATLLVKRSFESRERAKGK